MLISAQLLVISSSASSNEGGQLYRYRKFSLDLLYPTDENTEEVIPSDTERRHKMFAPIFSTGPNRIMMCGGGVSECNEVDIDGDKTWTPKESMIVPNRNMPGVAKKGENQVWVTGGILGFKQCTE